MVVGGGRDRAVGPWSFILLFSIGTAALFQWPLYRLALSTRSALDVRAVLDLLTLFVLQLTLSMAVLGLCALLSVRLMQWVCALLTVGNAVALYFIVQYRVFLDETMVGNIVRTNVREASELAHPAMLLYVLVLGVIPAVLLLRRPVRQSARWRRAALLGVSLLLGAGWLYANAQSWLWIDRNAKAFGGLVLPWSYVINTVRYFKSEAQRHRVATLLPPITSSTPGGLVFVLVIGEAARAQNFSLYGYARDTNPRLKEDAVVAYAGARACATYTTAALRCMLSHKGAGGLSANDEPLPSYLYRYGIEVIWRSNNFGEPPLKVSRFDSAPAIRASCTEDCGRLAYDEVLLNGLAALLRAGRPDAKTLVILHQGGSHGPLYAQKYPPEFARFQPTCRSVELQRCGAGELVNAYDNTIVYTDTLLHRLIGILRSLDARPAVMLYMSDHGESLGEGGLYLHGVPMAVAPEVQIRVPLLVWMSEDFRRRGGGVKAAEVFGEELGPRVVFHSVMGAMGLLSAVYRPDHDLFQFRPPAPTANREAK